MYNETEIVPAIIPEDFDDLKFHLGLVKNLVQTVQIDVLDGIYTPRPSWPYAGGGNDFQNIINQEEGFPFWENLNFEVDMMVLHPEEKYEDWIRAGASRIIFHLESLTQKDPSLIAKIKSENTLEVGIATKPSTDFRELEDFLPVVDFVQFMGIEKIGFQGQEFDERVLPKIEELREKYPDMTIAVDGSVNFETAKRLVDAGANRLVSGSAIFGAEDISDAIKEMQNLL
jgi:ribulose-phosphate 3-epimerase